MRPHPSLCSPCVFSYIHNIFLFTCCPVTRQSIPENQTSLRLIHKQQIVMQSALALHLIFTYLNTSPPLPACPPPATAALILCHGSEMRLSPSVLVQIQEQRVRIKYFSHSLTCFPVHVCEYLRVALYNSRLWLLPPCISRDKPNYHIVELI